jgi:CHAT domain-containing protein
VNEQSEHLSSAQIENYGDRTSGAGLDANHKAAWVEAHLDGCPDCRGRLLDFQRTQLGLVTGSNQPTDRTVNTASTPDCPSQDALRQLAAGLLANNVAHKLTNHAATCDHCGPLLRVYTEDFSNDFSPQEQAVLANLQSSSGEWQKQTARQMLRAANADVTEMNAAKARSAPVNTVVVTDAIVDAVKADTNTTPATKVTTPPTLSKVSLASAPASDDSMAESSANILRLKSERKATFWKWLPIPAAAAVTAALCTIVSLGTVGVWYTQRNTPEKVEKLLAQAYTEKRPMEFRWPGAEWGPVHITRGAEDSRFNKPASLLKAEVEIGEHSSTDTNNLGWLRAKAQAELLENHPQSAIDLLNSAMPANADSIPLLMDLAIAYSQQSEISNDPKDHLIVVDLLSKALKKDPENRVALFNLGIAYSANEMWDEAVSTWETYLRLDSSSPWAEEVKNKLIKAKKKTHSSLQYPSYPATDAPSFLALTDNEAAFRSEQYEEVALQYWLVNAMSDSQSSEHLAVTRLARILAKENSDMWWSDFITHAPTVGPTGSQALSMAFVANTKGHYADAIGKSVQAEKTFKRKGNSPGEFRARFEYVYAQQRLLHGKHCMAHAGPLEIQIIHTRYRWLQSQLAMELAVCLNYVSNFRETDAYLSRSYSIADDSHLPLTALRSIGFSQGLKIQQGKLNAAWQEGVRGLQAYWLGPPSTQRIYQFYAGFALCAGTSQRWSAAEAFLRHAIDLLRGEKDDIQKGAAWMELSKILIAERNDTAAEAALVKANQLFANVPGEPTARSYRLNGSMGLAEIQLRHGRTDEALLTLAPTHELLSETDPYFILLHYYRLSGDINFGLSHLDQSSSSYKAAIIIAERALSEIRTDKDRLEWVEAAEDAYRGLVRVFLKQGETENALRLWEWYISRSFHENLTVASHRLPHAIANWDDFWTQVPSIEIHGPTARIIYSVFDDGVEIWIVPAKGKPRAAWVPVAREKLEDMVRQFSAVCARENSPLSEVHKRGQDLFTLLLQPVAEELSSASLIAIELDQPLSNLPMEALRSPNGWYLGENYPITYSPGIIFEQHLRPKINLSSKQSFLLVDSSASRYLPGHEMELSTIRHVFPQVKIAGSNTSADVLASLSESDIFAFIGHGEAGPTGTGLRVNSDLLLKAEDFHTARLHHLQLAVLAACSTASSDSDGLLDNRSLVHAFLSGKVPSIVASHWNVDSDATAALMSEFYLHVDHDGPSNALFFARNKVLQSHQHPYFWSAFTLTGKSQL